MIFTGAPVWFIVLCVLLAAGYALGLYFRERKTEMPAPLRGALGVARFLSVFFIAFLLLSPFIRTVSRTQEKPVVVVAQDNSASVTMNFDSAFYRTEYLKQLDELARSLESGFDVKRFVFGESAGALAPGQSFQEQVSYDARLTDVAGLFTRVSALYSNRNLGAVVLATDGIYNAGFNPVYQASRAGYPVYSLALGDTARRRDLILAHVAYNSLVYLDNSFPLQVTVNAHDCEGSTTTLSVTEDGQTVFTKTLPIDRHDFSATVDVTLQALETGLKRYRISLSPAGEELSLDNNAKDIYIEVLDARNKILILYHSPHPDVTALRQVAEVNMNYEVEDFPAEAFTGQPEAYNLVILHQVPSNMNPYTSLLKQIREKEVPVLFILGTQSDIPGINQWEQGLKVISPNNLFGEALPTVNPDFSLFTLGDETRRLINSFPPLTVPSGSYQQGSMASTLLFQRIGSVETDRPLLLLGQNLQYRSGWITGEGIWRWRLMNYASTGDHEAFNDLFNKVFQYLSLKEQRKNLRIYHKSNFPENATLQFDAEVYNMNYELINDPELEITITDEEGRQFPYTFSRTLNAYRLDAGRFPPGKYSYQARVEVGSDTFTATGSFTVSSVDLEALQLVADHNLLRALTDQSGGRTFLPGEMDDLREALLESSDIKPVIYTSKRITELIHFPGLLAAILLLLSLEWFMRKRSGSY